MCIPSIFNEVLAEKMPHERRVDLISAYLGDGGGRGVTVLPWFVHGKLWAGAEKSHVTFIILIWCQRKHRIQYTRNN